MLIYLPDSTVPILHKCVHAICTVNIHTWFIGFQLQGHPQISSVHKLPHVSGDRPSSSDSDLRGSQFQVLPPIGAHCVTYEEWKKMLVHNAFP